MKKLLIAFVAGMLMVSSPILAANKLEPVTFLLPAPQDLPAFAPWRIAKHQGYFEEEGLDVSFAIAKGGVDIAKQVGAGNAPIGLAVGDTPIMMRANGIPVKSVALIGAGGLTLITSRVDNPITEPAQLKGKTITVMSYSDSLYYTLMGTMSKAGLKREDANIQAAGPAGVWQLFASGKSDAMAASPDWVVNAQSAGNEVYVMDPAKSFGGMAQSMIASDDTIKNNPRLIQGLVRATIRSMKLLMEDPETAFKVYMEAVPAHKGQEEKIREILRLCNKYMYAGQKVPGLMDAERLANVQAFYVSHGFVSKATPLEELYTNQFIEQR